MVWPQRIFVHKLYIACYYCLTIAAQCQENQYNLGGELLFLLHEQYLSCYMSIGIRLQKSMAEKLFPRTKTPIYITWQSRCLRFAYHEQHNRGKQVDNTLLAAVSKVLVIISSISSKSSERLCRDNVNNWSLCNFYISTEPSIVLFTKYLRGEVSGGCDCIFFFLLTDDMYARHFKLLFFSATRTVWRQW